jgi:ferredoxin-type protein NapH
MQGDNKVSFDEGRNMGQRTKCEAKQLVQEEKAERGQQPPTGMKERRGIARKAANARRVKQAVMGTGFMTLVGAGWVYPVLGYFIPLCMVLGIGVAAFRGRQWCNWLCPRGSFSDIMMKAVSPARRIPAILRRTPVRLGVLSLLMIMLGVQITRLWPDLYAVGGFFVLLLTITTVVGILLALISHQRAWCNICPIGYMSNLVGKTRYLLTMDRDACVDCKVCGKVCPMQLAPHELKIADSMAGGGDCLKCGLCVATCPKDALALPGGR